MAVVMPAQEATYVRRMTKFMTRADAGGMNGDIGQKDRPQTAPISLPIRMPSSGAAARMGTGWNGVQARDMQLSDRELIERTKVMLRSNLRSPALHRPLTHHPRQGLPYHYGASLHGLTGMTPTDYRVGGTHDVLRRGK